MTVLSLFDGISVGHAALVEAGIPVATYYASEIDKYAIQVTMKNFPDTIQLGDVCQVKGSDLPKIDILIGGSPCQGFSFAGKQLNFDDPRSKLFFEFVRILEETNPTWFLLENVIMKPEYSNVITKALGVSPIRINSNLVSAQNRDRLYWTNIPYFLPPQDRGIMLRDIIHENTDGMDIEKYKVPITRAFKLLDSELKKRKIGLIGGTDGQANRVYSIHGKAITLNGSGGGGAANMGQYLIPSEAFPVQGIERGEKSQGGRRVGEDKMNTLSTKARDGVLVVPEARTLRYPRGFNQGGIAADGKAGTISGNDYPNNNHVACFGCISPDRVEKRQNGQRFNNGDKFYTLTAQDQHGILTDGYIRKLTPIECCRLQTLPDSYCEGISPTQQYRCLGNGWTRDVIVYIFKGMKEGHKQ